MAIIDAQVHLWRKGIPTVLHIDGPFLVEDALKGMDEAGVDGAILHPPASWDPDSNEQCFEAAAAHPKRFAILANPPLYAPNSRQLIGDWMKKPGVLGYRFYSLGSATRNLPLDDSLDWLWPAAEKAGARIALLAGDWLPRFGEIAARHPGLKMAVDHMGALRGSKGDAAFPVMKELVALAKYPNVSVKLTGGPFYADDAYPFRSLHKHYRVMYDAFGPRRLFWGTDITKMPCSWKQCVTHFQEIDWIPEADKKLIMGDAIVDWLGWKR
ncbi:MAG: amidohydrolase family protein [Proteobacteria bacterium]|nr:amidohydrolase family protein [Pseudomonadota bacterium]